MGHTICVIHFTFTPTFQRNSPRTVKCAGITKHLFGNCCLCKSSPNVNYNGSAIALYCTDITSFFAISSGWYCSIGVYADRLEAMGHSRVSIPHFHTKTLRFYRTAILGKHSIFLNGICPRRDVYESGKVPHGK